MMAQEPTTDLTLRNLESPGARSRRTPRIGLVLGAGIARGWSHVGVLRELVVMGLPIHAVCGCSSGALVAASFASGKLNVLENLAETMTTMRMLRFFDFKWTRGGLMEGRWIGEFFRDKLDDAQIEDLPVAFGAVATEYGTGREVWLRHGSLVDAARASIALPGLLAPVILEGRPLVDGAVVNPLPVSLCRSLGADIVIAIDLSSDAAPPPVHFEEGDAAEAAARGWLSWFGSTVPGIGGGIGGKKKRPPRYPEVISDAIFTMQSFITRVRLAADPPDLVLRPSVHDLGVMEFQRAVEFIERGVASVRDNRSTIAHLCGLPPETEPDPPDAARDQSPRLQAQTAAKTPDAPASA